MREDGQERAGRELLEELGWASVKVGVDGWPDRLVITGPGQHIWWEVKVEAKWTPAQKRRIPWLRARGETVIVGNLVPALRLLR